MSTKSAHEELKEWPVNSPLDKELRRRIRRAIAEYSELKDVLKECVEALERWGPSPADAFIVQEARRLL